MQETKARDCRQFEASFRLHGKLRANKTLSIKANEKNKKEGRKEGREGKGKGAGTEGRELGTEEGAYCLRQQA